MTSKTLIVLLGQTGIGKTELSLQLAEHLQCPILNCDSRQLYRGIEIGTAAPTKAEQQRVKHYFVGTLKLDEYYSAAKYEEDALRLLDELFKTHDKLILSGGSMLYIDAVCKGIDDIPTVNEETRATLKQRLEKEGLEPLLQELRLVDPTYYAQVDPHNTQRIVHALEIFYMTGKPFSSYRTSLTKERPFKIVKIGLQRPREELYDRINRRVDQMMKDGLMEEVKRNWPNRHLNALNTVGFKELFAYLSQHETEITGIPDKPEMPDKPENPGKPDMPDMPDVPDESEVPAQAAPTAYVPRQKGELRTLSEAIERIKKNTRVYAKKQMTWFAKDADIHWLHPAQTEEILKFIEQ